MLMDKNFTLTSILGLHFIIKPISSFAFNHKDNFIVVYFYFIQVKTTCQIILKFCHHCISKCVVFDGPGFASYILKERYVDEKMKNVYTTSTFKCLVQIRAENKSTNIDINLHFMSKQLLLYQFHIKKDQTKILSLPTNICNNGLCAISVIAPFKFHINANIYTYYQGIETVNCKYGGLAMLHESQNLISEIICFCQFHNGNISRSRSIFSRNSTLILVLYWYEYYSNISIKMIVSMTECKPLHLDICELHTLCAKRSITKRHDPSECLAYLNPILKDSNIKVSYGDFQLGFT